jgi:hypothetical protein
MYLHGAMDRLALSYVDNDPRPAYDYRAALWNAHFDFPGFRDKGTIIDGYQRSFKGCFDNDGAGSSYQVWVWCSVVTHSRIRG